MEIQASDSAASDLLAQVSTTMLAKGLKGAQEQTAQLLESLPALPESSGTRIDLLA